jgi:hypothetical protein
MRLAGEVVGYDIVVYTQDSFCPIHWIMCDWMRLE